MASVPMNVDDNDDSKKKVTVLNIIDTEVIIHPLVLLSVTDHYNRVAKDTRKRVVGVLLGIITTTNITTTIIITNITTTIIITITITTIIINNNNIYRYKKW